MDRNARASELPSERAERAGEMRAPELDEPPDVQDAILKAGARQELERNVFGGGAAEAVGYSDGVREAFWPTIEVTPDERIARTPKEVLEEGTGGTPAPYGLSTEFSASPRTPGRTKASVSWQDRLAQLSHKTKLTPEDAWHLARAAFGASIPPHVVDLFPQSSAFGLARERLTQPLGLDVELLATMPKATQAHLLLSDEAGSVPADHPERSTLLSQRILDRMAAEEARWIHDASTHPDIGPDTPASDGGIDGHPDLPGHEDFLNRVGRAYSLWADEALKWGHNIAMRFAHGHKSPRQYWIDATYHAEIEGRRLSDIVTPQGFDRLWRAFEVNAKLLTDAELSQHATITYALRGSRIGGRQLDALDGIQREATVPADAILDAWVAGDWPTLGQLGVTPVTTVAPEAGGRVPLSATERGHQAGAPFEFLTQDPTDPDFRSRVRTMDGRIPDIYEKLSGRGSITAIAGGVAADPMDLAHAREQLDRVPREFLNLAEHVAAGRTEDAELAYAGLLDRLNHGGREFGEFFKGMAAKAPRAGTLRLDANVTNALRSYSKLVAAEARTQGWIIERGDIVSVSPEMQGMAMVVGAARRGVEHADAYRKLMGDPLYDGTNNPLTKLCSDCATRWRLPLDVAEEQGETGGVLPLDVAEEQGETGGVLRYAQRWSKILLGSDQVAGQSVVSHYVHQLTDGMKRFRDTVWSRMTDSSRNRIGDPINDLLAASRDERARWNDRVVRDSIELRKMAGWKMVDEIHQSPEEWTDLQRTEDAERALVSDVLEGRAKVGELPDRLQPFVPRMREMYQSYKTDAANHVFRFLRRAAEQAIVAGAEMPRGLMHTWSRVFGDVTSPATVLKMVEQIATLEPGQGAIVDGRKVYGWGLRDYYPHIWRKDGTGEIGDGHIADPGQERDADEAVTGRAGEFNEGLTTPKWKASITGQYGIRHGLTPKTKLMRNLLQREMGKDGYVRDALWAFNQYAGRLGDKIVHENLHDDLDPLVFGKYAKLDTASGQALAAAVARHPTSNEDGRRATFGGVDENFRMQLRGFPVDAGYQQLEGGRWVTPPEGSVTPELKEHMIRRWRSDRWAPVKRLTDFTADDPEQWRLALSNGVETLHLVGKTSIDRAGVHSRAGGITDFEHPEHYRAIVRVVREATGLDIDTGRLVDGQTPHPLAGAINRAADAAVEFAYQSQLGGVVNTKAAGVQMLEGAIQNFASLGGKLWLETMPDMRGAYSFAFRVLTAADPKAKYQELRAKADSPFLEKVLPIIEAGHVEMPHLLLSHGAMKSDGTWRGMLDYARRASYASFTAADVFSKYQAHYATHKQMSEIGSYRDPSSGRVFKITPDYIPVGERFTGGDDVISAHDIARMVVGRTHMALPRHEDPGIVKLPGFRFLGTLGKMGTNITLGVYKDLAAGARFVGEGNEGDLWRAQRSFRYLGGLAAVYGVMATLFDRDVGNYVGTPIHEVGFGDYNLGRIFPGLKALPRWASFLPAYQVPEKASLPTRLVFGGKGEGLPATIGDAFSRMATGDQGAGQAFGDAFRDWYSQNYRTFGLGPFTRTGRPLIGALTSERSDTDPDHPYRIGDPWTLTDQPHTRARSAFDTYFGDLFLPGSSYTDAREGARSEWEHQLTQTRTDIVKDLHGQLQSPDPEERDSARLELARRGITVAPWREEKAGLLNAVPSYVRRAIGSGSQTQKLRAFAEVADGWAPEVRRLALRYILPHETGAFPKNLPPDIASRIAQVLSGTDGAR